MKKLLTIGAAAMLLLSVECIAAESPVSAISRMESRTKDP